MKALPKAEMHFVRAQRLAYPYGVKRVSPLFESRLECMKEYERIRPEWNGCNLSLTKGRFTAVEIEAINGRTNP